MTGGMFLYVDSCCFYDVSKTTRIETKTEYRCQAVTKSFYDVSKTTRIET